MGYSSARRPIPARPTPRKDRSIPSTLTTVLFVLFIIALLGFSIWWAKTHFLSKEAEQRPEPKITHDSLCATYTYDGEVVRWYVFVDPDYGTQWVYNDHDWRAFPRIGADGTQIGVQNQSDYE